MGGRWTIDGGRWTIDHRWSGKDAFKSFFFLAPTRETNNPFYCLEKMPNREGRMIGTEIFRKLLANTWSSLIDSPEGALIAKLSSSLQTDSPYGAECLYTFRNNRWINCPIQGKMFVENNHTRSDLPHRGYLFVENNHTNTAMPHRGYLFVESNEINTTMPRRGYLLNEPNISTSQKQNRHA